MFVFCFFFKQKTAYEMRISDWSSDVCSSDLATVCLRQIAMRHRSPARSHRSPAALRHHRRYPRVGMRPTSAGDLRGARRDPRAHCPRAQTGRLARASRCRGLATSRRRSADRAWWWSPSPRAARSEEPTSELQSLMRPSFAVFRLEKKPETHDYTSTYNVRTQV